MLHVAWKPRKFARIVLFRPIKKRSFNLLCVLDLFFFFFRKQAVNSVSDLFVLDRYVDTAESIFYT